MASNELYTLLELHEQPFCRMSQKWLPKVPVVTLHGQSSAKRNATLDSVKLRGGICITTYGTLVSQQKQVSDAPAGSKRPFAWDVVVFDEANKIKNNSTQVSKSSAELPAKMKLLLTGTPIQVPRVLL